MDDQLPRVTVTPYRDGPYLVRGPIQILDQDGNEISRGSRTIALCRCGRSQLRPFCDGTHRTTGFTAPTGVDEGDLPIYAEPPANGRD